MSLEIQLSERDSCYPINRFKPRRIVVPCPKQELDLDSQTQKRENHFEDHL
jgi:hypothetical protein